jgi:uncharacterized protein (TIGR03435 family)
MMHVIAGVLLALSGSLPASIVAKVTVTAALALIGVRLARRGRAAVRHALLGAAFGAMLALPVVSLVAPPVGIAVPVAGSERSVPAPLPRAIEAIPPIAPPGAGVQVKPAVRPSPRLSPSALWIAGWIGGAALSLLPMLLGLGGIRSLRRSGLPWRHGQSVLDALALDAGIRRRVDVLLHVAVPGPMTCGVLHPAIMLPPDAQTWEAEDLKRAMVHELEHVRRCDRAVHCLARAVCAVYWFHPLVWIAWRRLALEAERSCDDAVLARSEAAAYADQLVGLARRLSLAAKSPLLAMANRADLAARVGAVLNPRQRRGRARAFQVALACAAAAVAVIGLSPLRVVAAPRNALSTGAQSQPAATPKSATPEAATPAFEAVSIKPFPEGAVIIMSGCDGGPGTDHPGRINCEYTTPKMLLMMAYTAKSSEILGPGWLDSGHFNIDAKLPQGATKEQVPAMFRNLLAERFKLALHHETRLLPAYALTVAKGGLKIKESAPAPAATDDAQPAGGSPPGGPPPSGPPPTGEDGFPILRPAVIANGPIILYRQGRGRLQGGNTTLAVLAEKLSGQVGQVVIDETGLNGKYDMTLNWTLDAAEIGGTAGPGAGASQEASTPGASLFAAVEQQLGLKLVSKKIARDVIVVDRAEKVPTGN